MPAQVKRERLITAAKDLIYGLGLKFSCLLYAFLPVNEESHSMEQLYTRTYMCAHPLIVEDQPSSHDLEYLEDQINQYNRAQTGAFDDRALAIFVLLVKRTYLWLLRP
jgi:hypothetical protein